jgi:hypothetical protein
MSAARKRRCQILGRGHQPNPIAVRRSAEAPRRPGRLAAVEGDLITVFFGPGEILYARNHDTERLRSIIPNGGIVDVPLAYPSLLRTYGGYQFSLLPGDEELEPCTDDPYGTKRRAPKGGS